MLVKSIKLKDKILVDAVFQRFSPNIQYFKTHALTKSL